MIKKVDWKDIILWILFIIIVIFVFWYIFGDSPTFEQTILVFMIGVIFTITIKITQFTSSLNREVGEIKIGMKHSFNNVKNDINLIKKDLKLIKNKLKI